MPILQEGGELAGVLELLRKASEPQFGSEDEEIVESYLAWAAVALHCAHSSRKSQDSMSCEQQKILNEAFTIITK